MSQEHSQAVVGAPPARTPILLYHVALAATALALLAEFGLAYNLLRDHPTHAPELVGEVYGLFTAGLVALAAQAALVHMALLRPLREAARRITELNQALDQRSHRDGLTGALNRTAFEHMAVRELEALKRYGAVFCGIMLDLDGFRQVNERLGYETGDHVLTELAHLLKQHVRKADFVFRWRSGKFLILASGIEEAQAAKFAEKLGQMLAGHEFRQGVRLTASFGVAQAHPEDTPELFVARVKTSLSQAKSARVPAGEADPAAA